MLVGDTRGLPPALTRLSTTGLLRHEPADVVHGWIEAAIAAGLIVASKDEYRTLSLTAAGNDAMRGKNVQMARPIAPSGVGTLRRGFARRRTRRAIYDDLRLEALAHSAHTWRRWGVDDVDAEWDKKEE